MNFTGDLQNFHPKTSIIFNDVTNVTQICYHLVYPKNFDLMKKPKRTIPANREISNNKRRRRGRPRKEDSIKPGNAEIVMNAKTDENTLKLPCSRTRSGRVSRPPKHMSKFVDIKEARSTSTATATTATTTDVMSAIEIIPLNELGQIITPTDIVVDSDAVDEPIAVERKEPRKIRKNVDRFTCSVCRKIYLGRKKLLKHYFNFPDHRTTNDDEFKSGRGNQISNVESPPNMNGIHSFLFDELMKVVGQTSQVERIPTFLYEVSNFLCKLRSFKSKLMHTNGTTTEHFLDKHVSKLFDVPEGLVNLDTKAFDEHSHNNSNILLDRFTESQASNDLSTAIANLSDLDYGLNLFNPVGYDQISHNSIEAEVLAKLNEGPVTTQDTPILDIPMDLFSFDNIK